MRIGHLILFRRKYDLIFKALKRTGNLILITLKRTNENYCDLERTKTLKWDLGEIKNLEKATQNAHKLRKLGPIKCQTHLSPTLRSTLPPPPPPPCSIKKSWYLINLSHC